jgi:hypothetical protein
MFVWLCSSPVGNKGQQLLITSLCRPMRHCPTIELHHVLGIFGGFSRSQHTYTLAVSVFEFANADKLREVLRGLHGQKSPQTHKGASRTTAYWQAIYICTYRHSCIQPCHRYYLLRQHGTRVFNQDFFYLVQSVVHSCLQDRVRLPWLNVV